MIQIKIILLTVLARRWTFSQNCPDNFRRFLGQKCVSVIFSHIRLLTNSKKSHDCLCCCCSCHDMMIPSSLNLTKRNEKLDFFAAHRLQKCTFVYSGGEGGIRGPLTPLVRTPIIPPPTIPTQNHLPRLCLQFD